MSTSGNDTKSSMLQGVNQKLASTISGVNAIVEKIMVDKHQQI